MSCMRLLLLAALLAGSPALAQEIIYTKGVSRQTFDRFGNAVGLDGARIAIGAPAYKQQGAVHILERVSGEWEGITRLEGTDGDEFGTSLALEGDVLIVGAPGMENGEGRVLVFARNGAEWNLVETIAPVNADGDEGFGNDLELVGDRLFVSAPRDDLGHFQAGAVYLFEFDPGATVLESVLTAPDPAAQDYFGFAMDADGNKLIVGAYQRDAGAPGTGAAWIFEEVLDTWVLKASLESPDPVASGFFGRSVSIRGEYALVGQTTTTTTSCDRGAGFHYRRVGEEWVLERVHCGPQNQSFGALGHVVALHGIHPFVGTTGIAFAYRYGKWNEPTSPGAGGALDLDSDGETVAIGLSGYSKWPSWVRGVVFLFQEDELYTPSVVEFCLCDSGPCEDDPGAGCVNSTGVGARLDSLGSVSVTEDDLILRATQLPQWQLATAVMGGAPANLTVGDGELCVGAGPSGFHRFPPVGTGFGSAAMGPGILAHSQDHFGAIAPGETRYFQLWYRDPDGPCGGGSNFTNALAITFVP